MSRSISELDMTAATITAVSLASVMGAMLTHSLIWVSMSVANKQLLADVMGETLSRSIKVMG